MSNFDIRVLGIFLVQLSEIYHMTVLFPFVVFMVRDFGVDPDSVGVYVGLLAASFSISQLLFTYGWGWISDVYSRRVALFCGLVCTAILSPIFGTSKNLTQAFVARSLAGFFNGNMGVLKAYTAEISTEDTRAFNFSILGFASGFGAAIAPLAGGTLVNINWWIFKEYPYAIPCIIGSIVSLVGACFALCMKTPEESYRQLLDDSEAKAEEYNSIDSRNKQNVEGKQLKIPDGERSIISGMSVESNHTNLSHITMATTVSYGREMLVTGLTSDGVKKEYPYLDSLRGMLTYTLLGQSVILYGFNCITAIMFTEVLPLYVSDTLENKGLEWTSDLIGYMFATQGVTLIFYSVTIQPWAVKRFDNIFLVRLCCLISLPMYAIVPSVAHMNLSQGVQLFVLCIFMVLSVCVFSLMFTVSILFVNNSVPFQQLGRANGIGQSFASFVRGVGPAVIGGLWSWSIEQKDKINGHVFLPFMFCALLAVLEFLWTFLFSNALEKSWNEREAMGISHGVEQPTKSKEEMF